MSVEYKPCPFCGNETTEEWGDGAWSGVWVWRYCAECHAHGPHILTSRGESAEAAQKRANDAWNERVPS